MLLVRSYFKEKNRQSYNTIPPASPERLFDNIQVSDRFTNLPEFKYFLWTIRDFHYGTGIIFSLHFVSTKRHLTFFYVIFLDFKQDKCGWIFYTSSDRNIPDNPKLLSWQTHSWYNIHEYILFNQDNLHNPVFKEIEKIEILSPNPLDRSLWRVQDYKNEMRHLKEIYSDSGDISRSRYFIQVIYFYLF